MDFNTILSGVLGVLGGLAAAGSLLWRASGQLTKLEEQIRTMKEHQDRSDASCKASFERLDDDFSGYVKDQDNKWQDLNRTLGQIEGELRTPRKSRPG